MEARNDFSAEENTALTPRIVAAQRRANMVWLVGAIAAFLAAGGISLIAGADKSSSGALELEAQRIGAVIDASAMGARERVKAIAENQKLIVAATQTDAATLGDTARSEVKLTQSPGETLEIFYLGDGKPTSVLRMPTSSTAISAFDGQATRLENSGKGSLDFVAGWPLAANGKAGGEVALSVPVDLAATRQRLSEMVVDASLVGVGQPLVLVPAKASAAGKQVSVPVQANPDWKLPPLSLSATLPNLRPKWLDPARYAALGLGGLMVLMFLFGLRRR